MPATNDWDKKHQRNLSSYEREVDEMFDTAVKEAARIADIIRELKGEKPFSFDDYPEAKKRVNKLLERLTRNVTTSVVSGIRSEWTLANDKNNELCNRVFGDKLDDLTEAQRRQYYTTNSKARQAFEQRRVNGLSLSDRVWNYTSQFKEEIEWGLDIGLRQGRSAAEMARDLKQYLKYPDKLFRRVRDEHENLRLSRNAKAFHPGMGVYRSSYKNARRLAVTETNMAYRTSDYERWQKLDFVVGMHIIRSNNHTTTDSKGKRVKLVDICDELSGENERDTKGRYPKSFKFTGWHPQCRCYAISILKTEEERREDRRRRLAGEEPLPASSSINYVGDVPQEFKTWVAENSERINTAKSLPYFISDNRGVVDGILQGHGSIGLVEGAGNGANASGNAIISQGQGSQSSELNAIANFAKTRNVAYNDVAQLKEALTSEQAIAKLGSEDITKGSCASVALAYAGNRAGYDVADFRGGSSRDFFSVGGIHSRMASGVGGLEEKDKSEFKASNRLLSQMVQGKEYFFNPGHHAAIVRLSPTGKGCEYLELQRGKSNGWHKLDNSVLRDRFDCSVSRKYENYVNMIDIELLGKDIGFRELLGYINTKR